MKVFNIGVYDLEESLIASGYPMATEIHYMSEDVSYSDNDLKRMIKLGNTQIGSGHDQALTGIRVAFDLTFTNKAWVELERYHFIDFVSSQSTMHKISKFDLRKQYNQYVDTRIIKIMEELKNKYNESNDKEDYLRLLYSNPCGFELTARLTTNYRQLKTVYIQRNNHRLPEWREFCEWILTLPKFKELTGIETGKNNG